MATIRPSSDLRNKYNEISEFCNKYDEPVFITKNGTGDLVVLSNEAYERLIGKYELKRKKCLMKLIRSLVLKNYNVIIELTAQRDLQSILHYIKNILKAPEAANRIYIKIKNEILMLNQMPMRNNVIKEQPYASMGVRKLLIENYIAFYIIDEQKYEVHVLRILYNRREWQNIL